MNTVVVIIIVIVIVALVWYFWYRKPAGVPTYDTKPYEGFQMFEEDAVITDPTGQLTHLIEDGKVMSKATFNAFADGVRMDQCPNLVSQSLVYSSKLPSPPEESIRNGVDLSDPATMTKPYINASNRAISRVSLQGNYILGDLLTVPNKTDWFGVRGDIADLTPGVASNYYVLKNYMNMQTAPINQ